LVAICTKERNQLASIVIGHRVLWVVAGVVYTTFPAALEALMSS